MRVLLASGCLTVLLALSIPQQSHGIQTGFVTYPPTKRWIGRMHRAGATAVRVNVRWNSIAPSKPRFPTKPGDPAYRFAELDKRLKDLRARGFKPILTIYAAPGWAQAKDRPRGIPANEGVWKPNATAFGAFAHAIARRYSGSYPRLGAHLPVVRDFEIWNEPNLTIYLRPQWVGDKPYSPTLYANLLNAAYKGIKSVSAKDRVIGGVTAPYGSVHAGAEKMAPILFLDNLFCVHHPKKCAPIPHMNVISHHPINRTGSPTTHGPGPMDVSVPDLGRIKRVVRAAKKRHRILPGGKVPLWVTEFWWESNPPDRKNGVRAKKQARWIAEALHIFSKAGVPLALTLQIVDTQLPHPDRKPLTYQAGIYFHNGRKKPAYPAFQFPLVGHRVSKRRVSVWGQSPHSGRLKIQAKGRKKHGRKSRWATVKSIHVRGGKPFTRKVRLRGHGKLRAKVGKTHSFVWAQR